MREVVFVDGARTAFGRLGGGLRQFYMTDLAGMAIRGLVDRTGILERGGKVDSVFMGCALGEVHTNNPARVAELSAGLGYETTAHFVEMQCGSGIASINQAAYTILCGGADVVIAGGAESYSQCAAKFSMCVEPYKMIAPRSIPQVLSPFSGDNISMIEVSDRMATKWGISREDSDAFALRSQKRAEAAYLSGMIEKDIIPVIIPATKKTPEIIFDKDEQCRFESTMDGLAKLKPVNEGGVTTAGNASGRNDGAAFILMMTMEKARELGYEPIARWVCGAVSGVDPKEMGIGPAFSNVKAMKQAGLRIADIDVLECNEAFAAQNLSVIKEMEKQMDEPIDQKKWNPNGGAISFGHPNGASGGRIGLFAMRQLQKTGGRYGLFSSCCGGGLGVTTVIERI